MTIKLGSSTWYNDCNGSNGACKDCDNAALHAAYPHLGTGCIYDSNCSLSMCAHSCGDRIHVLNQCSGGVGQYVTIHDCFPLQSDGCNPPVSCFDQNPPLVDLTEAAFLAIGGDLAQGRVPVQVVC